MDIYNKLYFLEYSKDPCITRYKDKVWLLNLSNKKCNYSHRDFDLYAYISRYYRIWNQFTKHHRLIGPAMIEGPSISNGETNIVKRFEIRDHLIFNKYIIFSSW